MAEDDGLISNELMSKANVDGRKQVNGTEEKPKSAPAKKKTPAKSTKKPVESKSKPKADEIDPDDFSDAKSNVFATLYQIDVSNHLDKKGTKFNDGLDYLSWSWAFAILKKLYGDDFTREFAKYPEYDWNRGVVTGKEVEYNQTADGAYVSCTVTIKGHSETQTLAVMANNKNIAKPNATQVENAKQRCFVKACALQGLGISLYTRSHESVLDMNDIAQQNNALQPATADQIDLIKEQLKTYAPMARTTVDYMEKYFFNQYGVRGFNELSTANANNILKMMTDQLNNANNQQ